MIHPSHPSPTLDLILWDEDSQSYRAGDPNAAVRRFVGPYQPARSEVVASGDEWRKHNVARDPVQLTGCVLHLDAATIPVQSDGTDLDTWPAVIGSTPTTPGNAPSYRTISGPQSDPCVEFVASSTEYMAWGLGEVLNRPTTALTVFIVGYLTTNTGEQTFISTDDLGYNGDWLMGVTATGTAQGATATRAGCALHISCSDGDKIPVVEDTGATPTGQWHVWAARYSQDPLVFDWWDSRRGGLSAPVDSHTWTGTPTEGIGVPLGDAWNLGRNPYATTRLLDGRLAEVVMFDRPLTDAEMESHMMHLSAKHGGLT